MILDKLKYALSLLDSNEFLILATVVVIYHFVIIVFIYVTIRGTVSLRERALESERDEYKKNWEHRDDAWRDREEELRRVLHLEKEREISQLKAEYDSYINLLEQKLDRSRTREKGII